MPTMHTSDSNTYKSIKIVFDTSYFEKVGYNFESSIFKRIRIGVTQHECIDLYIPENMDREIRKHLAEKSAQTRAHLRATPAPIRNTILKESFHKLTTKLISDDAIEQYESFIDDFRIQIIENDKECCDEMFSRYFSHKPPFSEKKKYEFSDAMALLSITKYFTDHDIDFNSVIAASSDPDWRNYCNGTSFTVIKDEHELLSKINDWQPILNESIIMKLLDEGAKDSIERKIKACFEDINKELSEDYYAVDFEIVDFDVKVSVAVKLFPLVKMKSICYM
jgi:hypothetical protein